MTSASLSDCFADLLHLMISDRKAENNFFSHISHKRRQLSNGSNPVAEPTEWAYRAIEIVIG